MRNPGEFERDRRGRSAVNLDDPAALHAALRAAARSGQWSWEVYGGRLYKEILEHTRRRRAVREPVGFLQEHSLPPYGFRGYYRPVAKGRRSTKPYMDVGTYVHRYRPEAIDDPSGMIVGSIRELFVWFGRIDLSAGDSNVPYVHQRHPGFQVAGPYWHMYVPGGEILTRGWGRLTGKQVLDMLYGQVFPDVRTNPPKRVCAWCKKVLSPGSEPATHVACDPCHEKARAELRAQIRSDRQRKCQHRRVTYVPSEDDPRRLAAVCLECEKVVDHFHADDDEGLEGDPHDDYEDWRGFYL